MAIDPKELRIGSHVEYMGERWEVAYITPKNKILYYALFQKNRPLLEVFPLEVKPIPITPELLIELGFEKIDFHGQDVFRKLYKDIPLGKMYYVLRYNSNAEAWDFTVHTTATTVKYLHELESMVYHATKRELISE